MQCFLLDLAFTMFKKINIFLDCVVEMRVTGKFVGIFRRVGHGKPGTRHPHKPGARSEPAEEEEGQPGELHLGDDRIGGRLPRARDERRYHRRVLLWSQDFPRAGPIAGVRRLGDAALPYVQLNVRHEEDSKRCRVHLGHGQPDKI